jgi:hypothetical protein
MKKSIFLALILGLIMSLSACENFMEMSHLEGVAELPVVVERDTIYQDRVVVKNDTVLVFIHDTIVVENTIHTTDTVILHDTVVVEGETVVIHDTIVVTKELEFECYTFNKEGYIVVYAENKEYIISYNVLMENSGDVYFRESAEPFVLKNKSAYFDSGHSAYFTVVKGEEEIILEVMVKGSNTLIINNNPVDPCNPFHIEAELTPLPDEEINGVTYEVGVIRYVLLNGDDEIIETSRQFLYAPKSIKNEEINDRKVTVTYVIEEHQHKNQYVLIINGYIDNTIYPDTSAKMEIPLYMELRCGLPLEVRGSDNSFDLGRLSEPEKAEVGTESKEGDHSMTVTYKEYENTYSHEYTASGKTILAKQHVRYYNEFVVSFGGEEHKIDLPINTLCTGFEAKDIEIEGSVVTLPFVVSYEAKQDRLVSTAKQEVSIVIDAIAFDGQKSLFANRSISFDGLKSPRVFDCVVLITNNGEYNFAYREIVDGVHGQWFFEPLSNEAFEAIEKGLQKSNSSLSVFFKKENGVTTTKVGYLIHYPDGNYIHYHAFGEAILPIDNVNMVMFGQLKSPILGTGAKTNSLLKMECEAGVYDKKTISPKEIVYLY